MSFVVGLALFALYWLVGGVILTIVIRIGELVTDEFALNDPVLIGIAALMWPVVLASIAFFGCCWAAGHAAELVLPKRK